MRAAQTAILCGGLAAVLFGWITAPWATRPALAKDTAERAAASGGTQSAPAAPADPLGGFMSDDPIVFTYYFYWYQYATGRHLVDPDSTDALTDHPIDLAALDFADPAWHRQQLLDMDAAGIDVALPVYWGSPQEAAWSQLGLDALSRALEQLTAEKRRVPAIGMFFDTSALAQVAGGPIDLTTEAGKGTFYGMIRDFFSRIPHRFWATIDDRPIVWLYSAGFVSRYGADLFDDVRRRFAADFGVRPYLVKEVSWSRITADNTYAWGAALSGPSFYGVAAVGPGYNDSAVPGRTTPVRDREGGAFYEKAWTQTLARRAKWVAVETWNEFHEGTAIAPTLEYGRQYVELTRRYVDMLKSGEVPEAPAGPYTGAAGVKVSLGPEGQAEGLRHVPWEDGISAPTQVAGRAGLEVGPSRFPGFYLYFAVDDSFASYIDAPMVLRVTYLDRGPGRFFVEYDSNDHAATLDGAYTPTPAVALTDSGTWKTATFALPHAFFGNRENGGSDFRINASQAGLVIGAVELVRTEDGVGN